MIAGNVQTFNLAIKFPQTLLSLVTQSATFDFGTTSGIVDWGVFSDTILNSYVEGSETYYIGLRTTTTSTSGKAFIPFRLNVPINAAHAGDCGCSASGENYNAYGGCVVPCNTSFNDSTYWISG